MATKPWDKPISGSMFGGSSFTPVQGQAFNSGPIWDQMKFDQPSSSFAQGRPFNSGPVWEQMRFDQPQKSFDWGGAVKSAVDLAKAWQSQGSGKLGGYEGSRSISGAAGSGGTERRLSPSLTLLEGERRVEQKQSAQSGGGGGGIGSAVGTIAGIGAAMIPGVGVGIAPFLPTIGSTVGGGIGSLFG